MKKSPLLPPLENLRQVFLHYAKKTSLNGKLKLFEKIINEDKTMNLQEYMLFCKEVLAKVMAVKRHRVVEIFKKSANKSSQEMNFKGFRDSLNKLAHDYFNDKLVEVEDDYKNILQEIQEYNRNQAMQMNTIKEVDNESGKHAFAKLIDDAPEEQDEEQAAQTLDNPPHEENMDYENLDIKLDKEEEFQ